jgi:hypothetical protein
MTPASVGVMTPQERDEKLNAITIDLESTTAEWADALDTRENDRANRALDDLEEIVRQLREAW